MAQGQRNDDNQLAQRAGVTNPVQLEHLQIGNALGITNDADVEGDVQVMWTRGRSATYQVILDEEWKRGQDVYRLDAGNVYTSAVTDAKVGVANRNAVDTNDVDNRAKLAGETSAWINFTGETRDANMIATIDFGATIGGVVNALGLIGGGPASDGRYTLRNYATEPAGTGQFDSLFFTHDGNLAPGGATISLGTTADPDAFMLATDITALIALGDPFERVSIALPAAATVLPGTEVIMTLTVANATAGRAKFELVNTLI